MEQIEVLPKLVSSKLIFGDDSSTLKSNSPQYIQLVKKIGMQSAFELQLMAQPLIARLTSESIRLDFNKWSQFGIKVWTEKRQFILSEIEQEINIGSISVENDFQIIERSKMKGIVINSLSSKWLSEHRNDHKVINLLMKKRQLDGLLKRFYFDLKPKDGSRFVYLSGVWGESMAYSGRFSSHDLPMTSLPKIMRDFYSAPQIGNDKGVYLSCDLSQIELRILAGKSNSQNLINDLNQGIDMHVYLASQLFNTTDVTKDQRALMKRLLYAIFYGAGDNRLSLMLDKAGEKAIMSPKRLLYVNYPNIVQLLNQFKNSKYFYYAMNPTRAISKKGDQAASAPFKINLPIQSAVSMLIKKTMVGLSGSVHIVNVIHDEFIFHCKYSEVEATKAKVILAFKDAAKDLGLVFPTNNFLKIKILGE